MQGYYPDELSDDDFEPCTAVGCELARGHDGEHEAGTRIAGPTDCVPQSWSTDDDG